MVEKARLTALVTALGITMTIALLSSPIARADENPFSINEATTGLVVAGEEGKCDDSAKCDKGKCDDSDDSSDESSCGEGKCGDNKDKADDDAKCGGNE